MGQIIEANFSEILPAEDGFDPCKIKNIINYAKGHKEVLPVPARKLKDHLEGYLHLDGRHRLLYGKMSGAKTAQLFLTESRQDYMSMGNYPNVNEWFLKDNNDNLARRWYFAAEQNYRIYHDMSVKNFDDFFDKIVENFPFMKDIASFEKEYKKDAELCNKWCESIVDNRLAQLV